MRNIHYSLFIVLCLVGCTKYEHAQREQAPLRVKTMTVCSQEGSASSRYVGTVEPAHEIPLSMQTSGRVISLSVKNGQHIKAGQTILSVDETQARNALRTAEASLRHAQDGYNRVKQVHDKGVVSDQKMVEIESQLAQARSLYEAAKQQLKECTLIAPCDGVVEGLKIEKGQTVIPGTKVCSLLDLSGFSVRFSVPESEANGEWLTAKGTVECAAVEQSFPVVVTEKSVTANTLTHTYDIVARIEGGADVLMTGMVAVVTITNANANANNLVIPANCILLKPEGPTVWLAENGIAVRRAVTVEGYQADGVRITGGLKEGDVLIIDGYQKLYNNCKVEIVD